MRDGFRQSLGVRSKSWEGERTDQGSSKAQSVAELVAGAAPASAAVVTQ